MIIIIPIHSSNQLIRKKTCVLKTQMMQLNKLLAAIPLLALAAACSREAAPPAPEPDMQEQAVKDEAQAAAQLHHPHIVPVFAVGQELGVYYYAMQYIAGQTLAEVVDGMQPPRSHAPRRAPFFLAGVSSGKAATSR